MHPLVSNLSALKDAELENKLNDLTRKYFATPNTDVKSQIVMIMDVYKEELANRRAAEYNKMMNNRDKGLDKLINVS